MGILSENLPNFAEFLGVLRRKFTHYAEFLGVWGNPLRKEKYENADFGRFALGVGDAAEV